MNSSFRRKVFFGILIVALPGFFLAAPVRADVGPPVKVRLAGTPRFATPGEPFPGSVKITAVIETELSNFRIYGEGWTVRSLEAPDGLHLGKLETFVVEFIVVSEDPSEPLVFAFDLDSRTVRKRLDLSRDHYERMREGGKVERVPEGDTAPFPGADESMPIP